jgi:hypothetical protein
MTGQGKELGHVMRGRVYDCQCQNESISIGPFDLSIVSYQDNMYRAHAMIHFEHCAQKGAELWFTGADNGDVVVMGSETPCDVNVECTIHSFGRFTGYTSYVDYDLFHADLTVLEPSMPVHTLVPVQLWSDEGVFGEQATFFQDAVLTCGSKQFKCFAVLLAHHSPVLRDQMVTAVCEIPKVHRVTVDAAFEDVIEDFTSFILGKGIAVSIKRLTKLFDLAKHLSSSTLISSIACVLDGDYPSEIKYRAVFCSLLDPPVDFLSIEDSVVSMIEKPFEAAFEAMLEKKQKSRHPETIFHDVYHSRYMDMARI